MSDRERRAALRAILAARHAWEIFGLPRGGNIARNEVQKQYRAMAKLVHPDKFTDPGSKSAMQKLNEALEHADTAVRIRPKWPKSHGRRAAALEALGRLPDACDAYREAARLSPSQDRQYHEALERVEKAYQEVQRRGITPGQYQEALKRFEGARADARAAWDARQREAEATSVQAAPPVEPPPTNADVVRGRVAACVHALSAERIALSIRVN